MDPLSHEQVVQRQFGGQAEAYLSSEVHAKGIELSLLAEIAAENAGGRILDLGCGAGHVSFAVAESASEVIAYDLSASMLDTVMASAASRGLTNIIARQGAAEELPYPDERFDCVFSRYSAHHWRDPAAALREVERVLRPGGSAVFVDVSSPGVAVLDTYLQAVEVLRDPSHVRDYSPAEWLAMVSAAGLLSTAYSAQKLHLDFTTWVGRMRTPDILCGAIRTLQGAMGREVAGYYQIKPDGSFVIDVIVLRAGKKTRPGHQIISND